MNGRTLNSDKPSLQDTLSWLDDLLRLEEGWYWGDGGTYEKEDVEWLKQFFVECYPSDLPYPYIYPMPTGGISVEWHDDEVDVEVDVEVDTKSHIGECLVYDDAEIDFDVDFDNEESVEKLLNVLRRVYKSGR